MIATAASTTTTAAPTQIHVLRRTATRPDDSGDHRPWDGVPAHPGPTRRVPRRQDRRGAPRGRPPPHPRPRPAESPAGRTGGALSGEERRSDRAGAVDRAVPAIEPGPQHVLGGREARAEGVVGVELGLGDLLLLDADHLVLG